MTSRWFERVIGLMGGLAEKQFHHTIHQPSRDSLDENQKMLQLPARTVAASNSRSHLNMTGLGVSNQFFPLAHFMIHRISSHLGAPFLLGPIFFFQSPPISNETHLQKIPPTRFANPYKAPSWKKASAARSVLSSNYPR